MHFNLKKPCKNCPFRNDKTIPKGWLGEERVADIYDNIIDGKVFPCHKTLPKPDIDDNYDEDIEEQENFAHHDKHQFCAGALILLEKTHDADKSNMIRMAERLGLYNKNDLDMSAPVFDSREELLEWHKRNK